MAAWVERADYGNADIGGGIDRFWLSGDLRISPLQQLDFLESLQQGALPFSADVMEMGRQILVREAGKDWSWSHKTGTALDEDLDLGWLVGSTENQGRSWVFALNLDLPPVGGLGSQIEPQSRLSIARSILEAEGALPAEG